VTRRKPGHRSTAEETCPLVACGNDLSKLIRSTTGQKFAW
jgi:hypothetical protein